MRKINFDGMGSKALLASGRLSTVLENKIITFRAHHFLCTLCFQGNGYHPKFIANYQKIVDRLRAKDGDMVPIHVVAKTDSICAPCPHRQGALCATQDKIDDLDAKHAAILNITSGVQLTWGEAKARIFQHMTLAQFHKACASCSWKSLGLCEATLTSSLRTC